MRIALLLLLALSTNIFAIDLTLEEAKKMALEQNENMKIGQKLLEKSEYTADEAYANAYPTIGLTAGYMRNFYSSKIPNAMGMANANIQHTNYHIAMAQAADNTDDPYYNMTPLEEIEGANEEVRALRDNDLSAGITLSQPLWTGGQVTSAIKIAKNYKTMSELQFQGKVDSIKTEVEKSFYTVLTLQESVKLMKSIQKLTLNHLKRVDDMFQNQLVSEYDHLRAKNAVREIEPQVLEIENGLELAKSDLKTKLGLDFATELNLLGVLDIDSNFVINENYYELVENNRKELAVLKEVSEMRKNNVRIEKGGHHPKVALVAAYNFKAQNDDITQTFDFDNEALNHSQTGLSVFTAGVQLQMPIFSGGATVSKVAQARVDYDNSVLLYENVKKLFKIQVDQTVQTIKTNMLKLEIQEEHLAETKRALEIADIRFANGVGTQLDYFDAQSQMEQASLEYLQIKLDLKVAQTNYKYFTGQVD